MVFSRDLFLLTESCNCLSLDLFQIQHIPPHSGSQAPPLVCTDPLFFISVQSSECSVPFSLQDMSQPPLPASYRKKKSKCGIENSKPTLQTNWRTTIIYKRCFVFFKKDSLFSICNQQQICIQQRDLSENSKISYDLRGIKLLCKCGTFSLVRYSCPHLSFCQNLSIVNLHPGVELAVSFVSLGDLGFFPNKGQNLVSSVGLGWFHTVIHQTQI